MKDSLKKVLKMVLILAVVVAAVVLLINIVFPKAKLELAHNKAVNIENNEDLSYIDDNFQIIYENLNTLDAGGNSSNNIADKLFKVNEIMDAYIKSNSSMKVGLLFNERSENYNSLANKLNNQYESVVENAKDTRDYMENTYIPYLNTSNLSLNDVLRYNDTFKAKYYNLLKEFDAYIDVLTDIYNESALISLQVNEITKLKAKYISVIGNGLVYKITSEDVIVNNQYLTQLSNNNFENLSIEDINEIVELNKKVDFNTISESIINDNLSETLNNVTNKQEYENFLNEFFKI